MLQLTSCHNEVAQLALLVVVDKLTTWKLSIINSNPKLCSFSEIILETQTKIIQAIGLGFETTCAGPSKDEPAF